MCGCERNPVAVIKNRVVKVSPPASATCHTWASLSQRGALNRGVEAHKPAHVILVGHVIGVALGSSPGANSRDQYGFGSNQ